MFSKAYNLLSTCCTWNFSHENPNKLYIPVWVLARDSSFPFRRLSRLWRLRHPSNGALSHLTFPFWKLLSPGASGTIFTQFKTVTWRTGSCRLWCHGLGRPQQTQLLKLPDLKKNHTNHTCFSFDTSKQKLRNLLRVVLARNSARMARFRERKECKLRFCGKMFVLNSKSSKIKNMKNWKILTKIVKITRSQQKYRNEEEYIICNDVTNWPMTILAFN